jgi:hypothetical protein
MPKLPQHPPSTAIIIAAAPDIIDFPLGQYAWRIYPRGGKYPVEWNEFRHYGPLPSARFDPHTSAMDGSPYSQSRGAIYIGDAFPTAIAEVFQGSRLVNPRRNRPAVTAFAFVRPLLLLNLWGDFGIRVGGSSKFATGPKTVTRAWSRAFYDALPDIDGIRYESSMRPGSAAYILYERAQSALPPAPLLNRDLDDLDMHTPLVNACHKIGYRLF